MPSTNNNSLSQLGATPGIIQPKVSLQNNPYGLSLNGSKSVNSGLVQNNKSIKVNVPQTEQPKGAPLPPGWNANLGTPSNLIPGILRDSMASTQKNYSGLLDTKPSTPLKKTTVNNVDGSSTIHEYHPKQKTTPTSTSPAPLAPPKIENPQFVPGSDTSAPTTPQGIDQGNLVRSVQQAGQATPMEQEYINRIQAAQGLKNIGQLAPYAEAGLYANQPTPNPELITQPDLAGRASAGQGLFNSLANIYGSQATQGLLAANTIAGRNLTAQTTAAGLNAPTTQFGLLTNPITGQIIGGEGSNAQQLMNTSLQKAVQYIQNGSSFNDAINTSGLGQFGELGKSLLSSAIGGGFNPTAYGTQVNTNQANLDATQKQAFSVSQNLQQVDKIEPVLLNFLQTSGVNPFDAQVYNGPVKDYLTQVGNSGAAASWAAQMGELKNFTSQLIASGYGGTPSGTEQATLNQDPSNLSYKGLQTYLNTLKGLGNNRLSVLQKNIQDLGGTGIGYSGNPAQPVSSVSPGTPASGEIGTGINTPAGQFGAGLGVKVGQEVGDIVTNGGNILSFILGKIF